MPDTRMLFSYRYVSARREVLIYYKMRDGERQSMFVTLTLYIKSENELRNGTPRAETLLYRHSAGDPLAQQQWSE